MVEPKDEATVQHSRKSQTNDRRDGNEHTTHTHDNNLSTEESRRAFYSPETTRTRVQTCTF